VITSLSKFYKSTLGKKLIMAVSGLAMILFLVGHMAGNLKIFAGVNPTTGKYKLDEYALFLREIGSPFFGHGGFLWVARIGLLLAIAVHILMAVQLTKLNKTAKAQGYHRQNYRASTFASRSMFVGGLFVLFFVVYHILHFTIGLSVLGAFEEGEVYHNVVRGFQAWHNVAIYTVALCAISLHLYHGAWSIFQTLGLDSPSVNPLLRLSAKALSVILLVGFLVVPFAIICGVVSLHQNSVIALEVAR
jgi:succinate dehydrogenase / fumarate reductase, cytochrome b subunit